jgi:hypothetical protein
MIEYDEDYEAKATKAYKKKKLKKGRGSQKKYR